MRTVFLSILVPVVVLLAWGLLFVVLDRISAAEGRAHAKRARDSSPGETDDEGSGRPGHRARPDG